MWPMPIVAGKPIRQLGRWLLRVLIGPAPDTLGRITEFYKHEPMSRIEARCRNASAFRLRLIAKPTRAGAVKVGRRPNFAAYSALARPYLDSLKHDSTLRDDTLRDRALPREPPQGDQQLACQRPVYGPVCTIAVSPILLLFGAC